MVQIVKLGGSVITDKSGSATVRRDALDRLAGELASAEEPPVIVHGAGSFGHPGAKAHGLVDGVDTDDERAGLAQVHARVRDLNLTVLEALHAQGLQAVTLSPFGWLSCNDGQPGGWNLIPVHRAIEQGLVPVSHGDLVLDTTRGVTVLSGDRIASELARFLQAERLVFALDQDGIHSHPPGHEDATLLETPDRAALTAAIERARDPEGADVTGGIAAKVERALEAARSGTEVCFVNGLEEGRLAAALKGKAHGTTIDPAEVRP